MDSRPRLRKDLGKQQIDRGYLAKSNCYEPCPDEVFPKFQTPLTRRTNPKLQASGSNVDYVTIAQMRVFDRLALTETRAFGCA